jgi:hypothetical protein
MRPAKKDSADSKSKNQKGTRSSTAGNAGIQAKFDSWVSKGYFDKEKTLAEVAARFHEDALILPKTSLPKYLLGAVRDERLSRSKKDVNGKKLWVYKTKT